MPNARFFSSGSVGINYASFDPNTRIAMIAAPFDWFEAIYQYTDVRNQLYSDNPAFSGNQTLKDKGFDFKINIIKERRFFPSIAVGARDIAGTGLFSSEYVVASKFIGDFDITAGVSWGQMSDARYRNPLGEISDRLNSRDLEVGLGGDFSFDSYFSGNIGFFGGFEYYLPFTKGMRLKLEYDPSNYEGSATRKPETYVSIPKDSDINIGLTIPLSSQTKLSFSFVRGNTFSIGFSVFGKYGRKNPLIPKDDPPLEIPNQKELKNVTGSEKRYLYRAALKYMNDERQNLRTANIENNKFSVSYSQNRFMSYSTSYGRALRTLDSLAPDYIEEFELIPMNAGFEMTSLTIDRELFRSRINNQVYPFSVNDFEINPTLNKTETHEFKPEARYPSLFYAFGPALQSHIGGPDRFFIGGLNFRGDIEVLLRKNISFKTIAKYNIYDSFDVINQGSDSILPRVRTDIAEYLKEAEDFSIIRSQFDYFNKLSNSIYTKISAGLLKKCLVGLAVKFCIDHIRLFLH